MGPDWSLLPPEIVLRISEKIINMDPYVHFRLVCRLRACIPNYRHLSPQFPWLKLDLRENSPSLLTLSLYDFSKSRIHNFELPGVSPVDICGHSRGWVVLEKDKELSFINPITRKTKSGCFPSLVVPPTVLGFARNEKNKYPWPSENHPELLEVVLTSNPSNRDCIVLATFRAEWELGFARVGDTCWTILKLREYGRGSRHMSAFKCKNELVYVINNKGCLVVYDLRDLSRKIVIDNLSCARGRNGLYLVLGEGELDFVPLIVKHVRQGSKIFEVFKCINETRGCKWRRVRNIGNSVLLLFFLKEKTARLGHFNSLN